MQSAKEFVIITGLSGAGKSLACRVFEDIGFFTVDNLPSALLPRFADLILHTEGTQDRIALVMDLRGGLLFEGFEEALEDIYKKGIAYKILYLEASDEVLIKRFKEARRSHPSSKDGSLLSGIRAERERLLPLKQRAFRSLDTSRLSNDALREALLSVWNSDPTQMQISLTSFGFKHGIPIDVDMLTDVRFIKNPYYVPELRPLTGRDAAVQDYVYAQPIAQAFITRYSALIKELVPSYMAQGKNSLAIGIGCTGGQHRSVAIAIALGKALEEMGANVVVSHRDH